LALKVGRRCKSPASFHPATGCAVEHGLVAGRAFAERKAAVEWGCRYWLPLHPKGTGKQWRVIGGSVCLIARRLLLSLLLFKKPEDALALIFVSHGFEQMAIMLDVLASDKALHGGGSMKLGVTVAWIIAWRECHDKVRRVPLTYAFLAHRGDVIRYGAVTFLTVQLEMSSSEASPTLRAFTPTLDISTYRRRHHRHPTPYRKKDSHRRNSSRLAASPVPFQYLIAHSLKFHVILIEIPKWLVLLARRTNER
jgi:hypothetical protein